MKTKTVHYFEYYPHYFGTLRRGASFNALALAMAFTLLASDKREGTDNLALLLEDIAPDAYALDTLFHDNGKALLRALRTKDTWAGMWEEGSHGISLAGIRHAKRAVALVESGVRERGIEYD